MVFSSKLLLFGEHAILFGSHALAIPITSFSAQWRYATDRSKQYNLVEFANYLSDLSLQGEPLFELDIERFRANLHDGLYLESNIPQGYGVGSSGALVAAICRRFARKTPLSDTKEALLLLKNTLGKFESFFHGSSSGIDPLVCYLNVPLLISQAGITKTTVPITPQGNLFLINTHLPRQTETWVTRFKTLRQNPDFDQLCSNELAVFNNVAIEAFCQNDWDKLLVAVKKISQFQYDYMNDFIPNDFSSIWNQSLENTVFSLKICGAGGGGFILGFTKDSEATKKQLNHLDLVWLNA
jgi:mevalonate kinase